MRRKTIIIATAIMGSVLLCCVGTVGLIAFQVLNNPAVNSGIQQLGDDLRDMTELQQKLLGAYAADQVEVRMVNGHILNVNLINSTISQLPRSEQAGKAKEIARFIKKNYRGMNKVDGIRVGLVSHQQIAFFNTNQSAFYSFDPATLPED